jgi:hypothetical protein
MFPGSRAIIIRNEAGEPLGWDYPAEPDYDPSHDDYDPWEEKDDEDND